MPLAQTHDQRSNAVVPNPPSPEPPTPPDPPLPDPTPDLPPAQPEPIHDPMPPEPVQDPLPAGLLPLDDLILRPVLYGRLRVGTVVDVVLNTSLRHVLGVDVVQRGEQRFLPWVALRLEGDHLSVTTDRALYPGNGLCLFLSHGTRLSQTWHRGALVVDRFGDVGVAASSAAA